MVNGKPVDQFFTTPNTRRSSSLALEVTETQKSYDVWVNVSGGGESGQAGAVRHGISRALLVLDPEFRPALKKAGFLTRDSRKVERKKYGQPGARKRFQFSKR